jgi:hypothetical protein
VPGCPLIGRKADIADFMIGAEWVLLLVRGLSDMERTCSISKMLLLSFSRFDPQGH